MGLVAVLVQDLVVDLAPLTVKGLGQWLAQLWVGSKGLRLAMMLVQGGELYIWCMVSGWFTLEEEQLTRGWRGRWLWNGHCCRGRDWKLCRLRCG